MFLRQRRKICKSHELPSELVIEILMRLPAKSLMRFKSVSKLWSSLICSQYFTNRCLKVSSSPRIYMRLSFIPLKNVLLLSSSPSDDSTMSSFVVDHDLTIPYPTMERYYSVSQVFRGLMCFTNGPSAKMYNITTRQLVALPDVEGSNIIAIAREFVYHIGHDPVRDQYKVLCTVSTRRPRGRTKHVSEHWVLLLGGGEGSTRWRKISSPCKPYLALTQRLSINGCVYYLGWVRGLRPYMLFSFNVRSEEISIFKEFEDISYIPRFSGLIEYGGRVALLLQSVSEAKGVMDLLVMDDAEKNIWSIKHFILDMHLLNGIRLRIQGTTRNGEVILVPKNTFRNPPTGEMIVQPQSTTPFHIFLYNLQNNHLRKVEIKETFNRYLTNIWDFVGLDDVENLVYL